MQTQAEVALAAADGDPNVAIEILMSQEACTTLSLISLGVLTDYDHSFISCLQG